MAIKYGKTEVKKVAALLDQDWESAEEAAEALLGAALEILEARGRWAVVGQLYYSRQEGGWIDHEDAAAAKVCLGLFSTRGDADKAAYALTYSSTTQEQFRAWVIEVEHGTANDLAKKRRDMHHQKEIEAKRKGEAA